MTTYSPIPTPLRVRWQRMRYQLFPVLMVLLCVVAAWRLKRDVPTVMAVGQVDTDITHVRAYLRAGQGSQLTAGTMVDLWPRHDPSRKFHARIERIGSQYERIPSAEARGHKSQEWGLPIIIDLPSDAALKTGELVDIRWAEFPDEELNTNQATPSAPSPTAGG